MPTFQNAWLKFLFCTFFVSVEQDALSFEDENDVFWVRAVHNSGRFRAEEFICFVHFFKHVLRDKHGL